MDYLFTSEAVAEGHPDKVCDVVSDTLLDLFLERDKYARTAIETLATTNRIILAGEVSSSENISREEIEAYVRRTIRKIGYEQEGFDWRNLIIENYLHEQSADIALGVDREGAGDQGIMFGYAKNEKGFNSQYMPLAISTSRAILKSLKTFRIQNPDCGLGPDAKSQVTIKYSNKRPVGIAKIIVSTQHEERVHPDDVRNMVKLCIAKVVPDDWFPEDKDILINPTGRFVIGGPDGDAGLTGRKIIVDTYGGYAPHGGGAFSGKDPTKVDRSAAYALRYLAKNVVAAGIADECLFQISYAIGVSDPISFYINTNKTSRVDEGRLLKVLREMVDLTPAGIIKHLNLRKPIYAQTACYGHFGCKPLDDGSFSWERLDLIEGLKNAFDIN